MDNIYFVNSLEQLRVLCNPLRIKLLWSLDKEAKTGKMLADEFGISPSKVRYSLKELERVKLLTVEKTEEKNGIIQKFYRPVAKIISIEKILPIINGLTDEAREALNQNSLLALEESESLLMNNSDTEIVPLIQFNNTLALSQKDCDWIENQLKEIYHFVLEKSNSVSDVSDKSNIYHINLTLFQLLKEDVIKKDK